MREQRKPSVNPASMEEAAPSPTAVWQAAITDWGLAKDEGRGVVNRIIWAVY
jgi:hypothetical protein